MSEHEKKETHKSEHTHNSKKKPALKIKKIAMWQGATVVFALLLIFSVATNVPGGGSAALSANEAGSKTMDFINNIILEGARTAAFKGVEESNNLYKLSFEVEGQEYPAYVSTDGKLLFLQAIDIDAATSAAQGQTAAESADTPKTEKPKVELFVMTHCPFGTMAEKGILPAVKLLGDKVDFSVKFVNYAMHGQTEIDEQLLQHCMQKEAEDKYLEYLECFLAEGDTERCIGVAGFTEGQFDSCIEATDTEFKVSELYDDQSTWLSGRYPQFNVNDDLNEKYGVRGSPHLVVNEVSVSVGRDPASMLNAVCGAFTSVPSECTTVLSSAQPSAGFGFEEGSAAASSATCG